MAEGSSFLAEKYPDLSGSREVQSAVRKQIRSGEKRPQGKEAQIEDYLNRLKSFFDPKVDGRHDERLRLLKAIAHDKYVIKLEEVPESYFDLQRRIAREQGHGNVEIPDEAKQEAIRTIITDQEKSLDSWFDYLASTETLYPAWFKYYVFRSVVMLADYDKEKRKFNQRSRGTTKLFPDLNREALAYVYNNLVKYHLEKQKEIADKELEKLLQGANFAKLYAFAIEKITPASAEDKERTQGEWIKYPKGSNPEPLWRSLQGHGTEWCIAGEETAKNYLNLGDIYVFYTRGANGKDTVPRVTIRMSREEIAEVRGINFKQNLEPSMTEIAQERMDTLPGKEDYVKRTGHMRQLTDIEKKVAQNQELSLEELRFLYEIDEKIQGFGYEEDPRIKETRAKRDLRRDYAQIFECSIDQVALTQNELTHQTIVLVGVFNARREEKLPSGLKFIGGYANFRGSEIKNLGRLQTIGDGVYFSSKIKNLGRLQTIRGFAHFEDLEVENLGQLQTISGDTYFRGSEIKNLGRLQSIGGNAYFWDSKVENLGQLQTIGGYAYIDKEAAKRLDPSRLRKIARGVRTRLT